jgi:outer membrane protein/adhesin transport system outer membrane protein
MQTATRLRLSASLIAFASFAPPALAQSIGDALSAAYTQNTQLNAARAQQRATDEQVPQALSNWRPTVSVTGTYTRQDERYVPSVYNSGAGRLGSAGYNNAKTAMIQVVQPIYRGGRTVAATSAAQNTVKAGQSSLKTEEQSILLSAAQSFLDVVRDEATVDLNANNEAVLKRELDAENDRFRVGEVTRTDVALAQASYQQARAQYTTAVGTLATDRATFQRVIGQAPGKLVQPDFKYPLPESLEVAVAEAEVNNPGVIQAVFTERASRDNVDVAEGARLPTVSLIGSFGKDYPVPGSIISGAAGGAGGAAGGNINVVTTGSIEAQVSWPLYTGGLTSSQVRQAKQTANQNLIAVEDAKRVARQTAITAWQQLTAAKANIVAYQAQVNAAQIGAEGTRQQALVGTATVLDSLTAEQNLLVAQVNLVGAQHDALLYSFQLLSAVGRLTAQDLALNVRIYDPQVNQDRVGDKWFGTEISSSGSR